MNVFLVFLGGGLGAVSRYLLQGTIYRFTGQTFPIGTMIVNIIGSFLIGLLISSLEERFLVNPSLRLFLTVGILGGFTTFSSFSFETVSLFLEGSIFLAIANVALSVIICLCATYLGTIVGRLV